MRPLPQARTAAMNRGAMEEVKKGLDAVANAKFPGKTVIFPNCEDMPLTPVSQLADILPEAASTYDEQGFYTSKTEKALLDKFEK